jgi:hypothetical protein
MHIEISPFGGSRFGGVVQLNPNPSNIDYFTIKSSWDYGVLGDVSLLPTFQAEFMWNRQPTELGAHNFFTGTTSQAGNALFCDPFFGACFVGTVSTTPSRDKPTLA